MSVKCQILFKKPKDGVHRAGHKVDGSLKYTIEKPGDFEHVTLSLIGKGNCSWSQSSTPSHGPSSISCSGKEKYVVIHQILPDKADEGTPRNCKGDDVEPVEPTTLTGGVHTHDFCFILPNNIPSSFKDNICTISYKVYIEFVRPGKLSKNLKFEAPIMVYGNTIPCSPEPIIYGLHKKITKPFATKDHAVALKLTVDKTHVTPGTCIKLALTINNASDLTITALTTKLIRYTTYTSSTGQQKLHKKVIKVATEQTASIKRNSVTKLSMIVPTLPNLLSIQNSKIMAREYRVMVTVRLPVPHLNASVEIPVVIANRFDDTEESKDQPPPSWDAMDKGEA